MDKKKLPFVTALSWVVLSVFLITGSSFMIFKQRLNEKHKRKASSEFHIVKLVQTGPQQGALKSVYLAELLGLSIDKPIDISHFDVKKARQQLLRAHVVKDAKVSLIKPQTVYIDYTVRQPIALLYDYENIAFDQDGYLFPLLPFYPPKKLPEVYFGTALQNPLKGVAFDMAIKLISLLGDSFDVRRIDVSNIFADTMGRRELVVLIEDRIVSIKEGKECHFIFPRLLRLSVKNYQAELGNYLQLCEQLHGEDIKKIVFPEKETEVRFKEKSIDLRLPQLAFIEE